jgi:hypothetical protein
MQSLGELKCNAYPNRCIQIRDATANRMSQERDVSKKRIRGVGDLSSWGGWKSESGFQQYLNDCASSRFEPSK